MTLNRMPDSRRDLRSSQSANCRLQQLLNSKRPGRGWTVQSAWRTRTNAYPSNVATSFIKIVYWIWWSGRYCSTSRALYARYPGSLLSSGIRIQYRSHLCCHCPVAKLMFRGLAVQIIFLYSYLIIKQISWSWSVFFLVRERELKFTSLQWSWRIVQNPAPAFKNDIS
jgi:hypothetical protein